MASLEDSTRVVVIGAAATAVMDAGPRVLNCSGVQAADLGPMGRWL